VKVLITPDVHERNVQLAKVLSPERLDSIDAAVFLGDWLDSFAPYDGGRVQSTIEFIMAGHQLNGIEHKGRLIPCDWIIGNHDAHYFFDHNGYGCSGYDPRKKEQVKRLIPPEVISRFKVFTHVGPYLVSHAGFHPTTLKLADFQLCQDAVKEALGGGYSPLFGAGYARGGNLPYGGPTWLDWSQEFENIPGKPQIVGHTYGKEVRTRGGDDAKAFRSWCIDTALKFVAIVDDNTGEVIIEEV